MKQAISKIIWLNIIVLYVRVILFCNVVPEYACYKWKKNVRPDWIEYMHNDLIDQEMTNTSWTLKPAANVRKEKDIHIAVAV